MNVLNRLSDVVNANLNAILTEAEDPEKMVRLIISDMRETLVEVRSASARYIADRKRIEERLTRLRGEAATWEAKAEIAIERGRDDLAKAALSERTRADEAVNTLEAELVVLTDTIAKLTRDTEQLEDKLRQARTRQDALVTRSRTTQSRLKIRRQLHDAGTDDALDRFEAYERRLDDLEGELDAYDLGNPGLDDEFAKLAADKRADDDLAELKARISARSGASS